MYPVILSKYFIRFIKNNIIRLRENDTNVLLTFSVGHFSPYTIYVALRENELVFVGSIKLFFKF